MKLNRELTKDAVDFIDDNLLHSLIENTKENPAVYRKIFEKSRNKQALTIEETAALLAIKSKDGLQELYETAKELKRTLETDA